MKIHNKDIPRPYKKPLMDRASFKAVIILLLFGIFSVVALDIKTNTDISNQNILLIQLENQSIIHSVSMEKQCQRKTEQYERCEMYKLNTTYIEKYKVNGVYFSDKYYVVWTDNINPVNVKKTEAHEMCHDLIFQEKKNRENHFCYRVGENKNGFRKQNVKTLDKYK